MPDVLAIGRYQLENLIREDIRFLFADLRTVDERAMFADPLVARAVVLSVDELRARVAEMPRDSAIVLLSEDGELAANESAALESLGFKNVYIVRGGARGLRA